MNFRTILILFSIFLLVPNSFFYSNALSVDGPLEIGFPFRFFYFIDSPQHSGVSLYFETLVADIIIALIAAWGVERTYFYIRKKINSA